MNLSAATIEESCLPERISAYIDGELAPAEELALEAHAANCKNCLAHLNAQKQMLHALDFALDEKTEIEPPENFAKIVAIRAETNVSGLRSTEERFRALFLCALLFLIVIVGLGAEAENVFDAFARFGEQFVAVAGFVTHLAYNLAIGATVILRSLGGRFIFGSPFLLIILIGSFALSAWTLSRLILRFHQS